MQQLPKDWESWPLESKVALLKEITFRSAWSPNEGPQTLAFESEADLLLYGGAAGGGKTDLVLGLARYKHSRAAIFRRVFPSLQGIIDRSKEIYNLSDDLGVLATSKNYNEGSHRWRFDDGVSIEFLSLQFEDDAKRQQGQARDFHGFDEITEFSEAQFRFVIGWNRSTKKGQRCRVVCTCNPPTDTDGEWVIKFWGPWLDPLHPHPAAPGELRWYTTVGGVDTEQPNGDPVLIDGEWTQPLSRTFIPAKVQDNPHLKDSGYIARLQALPEPLRSKMLYGDFAAGREDGAYQTIPSLWVDAAMKRWETVEEPRIPMTALGVDVARGGKDKTCLAPRRKNWFGKVVKVPGNLTPDGQSVAGLVLVHAKNRCLVTIDVIGVGSSAYDFTKENETIRVRPFNGASSSHRLDKSGQLHFINRRAESYWLFREMLDPANQNDVALPPSPELRADLCAPTWKITARGIQVESKEDLMKRIGRSPDEGDAVVLAALDAAPAVEEVEDDWEARMMAESRSGLSWMG